MTTLSTTNNELLAIILLIICVVPILLLALFAIFRTINSKSKKAKEHMENIEKEPKDLEQQKIFYDAYGGSENILDIMIAMSRITVHVADIDKVNGDALKELGATGVLLVGNEVKCSFGDRASYIYKLLEK
ncbi:MAG: PTS transporter subunit EIIB [Bacilli bacterium]|nr:PTS transporter subunit EIIB [Bacilli bacterium]